MTIDEIIIELERAWNAGDGDAWAANFSEDADFVDVLGRLHQGRDVITREHQKIFDTIYQGSRVEFRQVASRAVGDDVLRDRSWRSTTPSRRTSQDSPDNADDLAQRTAIQHAKP